MGHTIDEKRVYADRTGAETVLIASERGVVVASLSADRVGEFRLDHRTAARDVAANGDRRAVATDEDVLVGRYEPTGFGPAVAVGFDGDDLLAAGPDGRVARLDDGWTTLGTVETPRAVHGGMVAAADGVWMVDQGLRNVGLGDVRDVHGRGMPLAATDDGLYRLGNGWMDERSDAFGVVSVDSAERRSASSRTQSGDAADDRAHAVGEDGTFVREAVGEWRAVETPGDPVDVAYTDRATVAVTEGGTLLADAGEGWRTRELGVGGVSALAVRG
ncbi:HVO_0234 family beta-propeller protein [Haloplanus salilacus]|uniref:HVO_0234 family beta-propeller protein n=1 Tax=Haloplanus salilacus TaxID=2949994 RepID=UPI0030CCD79F